jgi:hypothetical protein
MIQNTDYFEQTDKYLSSEMTQSELKEFEIQMEIDSNLAEEFDLQVEVRQAICEIDVINLRNNLNLIIQNQSDPTCNEISVFNSYSFGLSEEFASHKNLNIQISSEDIFNFGHTFPQIHLHQHNIAGKENIHQFYKEQADYDSVNKEASFSPFEEEIFSELQTALDEHDIFDLRANLNQILQAMPSHQYSQEDIEDYIYGRMYVETRIKFEALLELNNDLAEELRICKEMDIACAEYDILNLRATINDIQRSELQIPASLTEIENYISNELSEEEMAFFEEELTTSLRLKEEINLIQNVDNALKENDVMQLRSKLQGIAQQIVSEKRTERSFAGKLKPSRAFVLSSVAASLILLMGITGILSRHTNQDDIYQKFYNKYETAGIVRSASQAADQTMNEAMQMFDNQEHKEALKLFAEVSSRDQNNMAVHFYTGISLQEIGEYHNAIKEYETVIVDKDNLFIEQARWYIGLCYLQTNENKKAYKQFTKIAGNDGFYQQKAQSILHKLKNTDQ